MLYSNKFWSLDVWKNTKCFVTLCQVNITLPNYKSDKRTHTVKILPWSKLKFQVYFDFFTIWDSVLPVQSSSSWCNGFV